MTRSNVTCLYVLASTIHCSLARSLTHSLTHSLAPSFVTSRFSGKSFSLMCTQSVHKNGIHLLALCMGNVQLCHRHPSDMQSLPNSQPMHQQAPPNKHVACYALLSIHARLTGFELSYRLPKLACIAAISWASRPSPGDGSCKNATGSTWTCLMSTG